MSRIIKFILIIILAVIVFEAGLISAYTIVTSQPPDVGKLLGMQIDELTSLISFGSGSNILNTQTTIKIDNPEEVADALKVKAGLDGINLQSLSAVVTGSTKETVFPVNITAMGYKDDVSGGNTTGGQITIKSNETYSITATANASLKNRILVIDVNTIQITSTRKLYGNTNGT